MTLDLATVFYQNRCMFCYPFFGLLSGVMQHLALQALVIAYSGKLRCDVTPVVAFTRFT